MSGRTLRIVALGESQDEVSDIITYWIGESHPDQDFFTWQTEEGPLEFYLTWPGANNTLPQPIDVLIIFASDTADFAVIRATYENFKKVVFKAVVGTTESAGLAFAAEINAKWTYLSLDEQKFIANLLILNQELTALMKSTFDSIDADGSGFINMAELTNVSKALGHELSEAELQVVFDELDENGDKKISFAEFEKWWKKGRAGKGEVMKKIVGMQAKAKRLIEGLHNEIAEALSISDIPFFFEK
jgi:Ca2+-binding EF-hand superfamily protein